MYHLQQGSEILESAEINQRVTTEVSMRKEMAVRAMVKTRVELLGKVHVDHGFLSH